MRINGNIRVVKSQTATEVFITASDPYLNFALHLPPDAAIKDGDSIEFVQEVKPPTKTEAELPGKVAPAAG